MSKIGVVLPFVMAAVMAVATPSAVAAEGTTGYYVSAYAARAKLAATYDSVSCSGIRRYGTSALTTSQRGWVLGYWRFECSYSTPNRTCSGGHFSSESTRGQWLLRMLSKGRCYSR
jgi:hypothetical protein